MRPIKCVLIFIPVIFIFFYFGVGFDLYNDLYNKDYYKFFKGVLGFLFGTTIIYIFMVIGYLALHKVLPWVEFCVIMDLLEIIIIFFLKTTFGIITDITFYYVLLFFLLIYLIIKFLIFVVRKLKDYFKKYRK
jgi:hypothetical protein